MTKEDFIDGVWKLISQVHPGPDVAPFVRLVVLGQRLSQRIVTGQAGDGIGRDARLFLDQMADLPDELRVLL